MIEATFDAIVRSLREVNSLSSATAMLLGVLLGFLGGLAGIYLLRRKQASLPPVFPTPKPPEG